MDSYRKRVYSNYVEAIYENHNAFDELSFKRLERVLRQVYSKYLPKDRTARILDIGCGPGYLVSALRAMGYVNVEGVDASESQVAIARSRGLNVTQCDLFRFLADHNDAYDAIVATDVMEHLYKDEILSLLDVANTSLTSEGVFICAVPNANSPFAARQRYVDLTHELSFTEETLKEIFTITNFSVLQICGERVTPRTLKAVIRYAMNALFKAAWRLFMIAELGSHVMKVPLEYKLIGVAGRRQHA
ncbi:MAG TPA: class I SAM-dependent methyltransferase [Sedimentisphaerales bacterium]|jgi:predicted TPR repeat methyltransferase|nr:class I SAM-dependent methyltransferase [Sedimentisphaerales bacterium]HNU27716.1 class I SAM-dependent methyltransferase [Sedimentisphaerales bacterium]